MDPHHQSAPGRRAFIRDLTLSTLGVSCAAPSLFAEAAPRTNGSPGMAQAVIYVYLSGGMSHLDSFDPKPNKDVMGATTVLPSTVDGMTFGNYFPKLAKQAPNLALVRSLSTNQGAHEQGNYFMHTSYRQRGTIRHPDLGAWIHRMDGRHHPSLPASVRIGGGQNIGRGFLESTYQPLIIGSPDQGLRNVKRKWLSEKEFEECRRLAEAFDASFHKTHKSPALDAYVDVYDAAIDLMKSRDLVAFNLAAESKQTRDAYGASNFSQGVLLARRLVEHGVRFVEVQMGGWDSHEDHFNRFASQTQILDQTLSALITDLSLRGMLEQTLVVVATEFGRTPRINANRGRDHYPKAFSGMFAGGGITGGTVFGKTDDRGENVIENAVDVTDFNATIGYALGIDTGKIVHSPSGRPFSMAHRGKPIVELFA